VLLGNRLSYGQATAEVDRVACSLHSIGVRRGDRVAIMLPNCPQAVVAYYAALSLGAVAVVVNPKNWTPGLGGMSVV